MAQTRSRSPKAFYFFCWRLGGATPCHPIPCHTVLCSYVIYLRDVKALASETSGLAGGLTGSPGQFPPRMFLLTIIASARYYGADVLLRLGAWERSTDYFRYIFILCGPIYLFYDSHKRQLRIFPPWPRQTDDIPSFCIDKRTPSTPA